MRVLVDDRRRFRDRRTGVTYRSSTAAVAALRALAAAEEHLTELWLDHDLGGGDTVAPVLALIGELAAAGRPLDVGEVVTVTADPAAAAALRTAVTALGYRCTAAGARSLLLTGGEGG